MVTTNQDILDRLAAIESKLDYVVERQRWTEELVEEMTPIAKLMMGSATRELAGWEARGAFAMLAELRTAVDHVLASYTPEDARQLAGAVVGILGTIRNVTQPDVLEVANDATDVLHHASEVAPVGVMGAMRQASTDAEVRRGLGVALQIMRQLGRVRGAPAGVPRLPAPRVEAAAPRAATAPSPAPATAPAPEPGRLIRWEGRDFDEHGFLIDPSTWDPELAGKIAAGLGIALGDEHWTVIQWVRSDFAETGASPNVRRSASGSGVGTQAMYRLFPPTPGKTCAMIAGVPKPVGCV